MLQHDFYGLPRSIQDRFIESSQGAAAPAPIAVEARSEKRSLLWGVASLVLGGAWGGFVSMGFGDLYSPFALGSLPQKLIHVAFGAAGTFCALRAYALSWVSSQLPYGTGDYLFPSGVITANLGELTEVDSSSLQSVSSQGKRISVQLGSETFQFASESAELAKQAAESFEKSAAKWKELANAEPLERARLNPLTDSGVPNPLAPTQPHVRPQFLGMAPLIAIAVVVGLGLGFGVSTWRDSMSQKALYKAAVAENTVKSYQAYLDRGGDKEEVRTLLLPRAELEKVIAAGTVEAITQFIEKHPDTKIGGEVQNALRAALLRELDLAKKKGTLSAVEGLSKRFKQHELIAAEIGAARRDVFAQAMASFQKQASPKEAALIPFVQQLLTYAEQNGPTVEIRVAQTFKQDPARLDKIVSKSKKYYMGRKSLPTQYFLGDTARRREKVIVEKLQKRLQAAFPKDILEFKLAAAPQKENEDLPEIKVPTLTLTHDEKLSGGYVGGRPKAMYMASTIILTVKAELPGQSEPGLSYTWPAWRNPDFSILVDSKKDIPDVYEHMVMGTFEEFMGKYLARWFREP